MRWALRALVMAQIRRHLKMTLQFDPRPGPPFCGHGRLGPRWEPWMVLGLCAVLVVVGWLWGR